MTRYIELFQTKPQNRVCGNCIHFDRFTQWSGTCAYHNGETDTSDSCEKWDGE